jgi:hypothetical protein
VNIRPITIACAIAATCALVAPLSAEPEADRGGGPHVITIRSAAPERDFHQLWQAGDHAGALEAINLVLRSRPTDALLLYNRACAKAQLGKLDDAASALMDAVRNGFDHFSHMQRDPDLAPMREHRVYRAIVAARAFADELLAERRLAEWRERTDEKRYTHVRDEALRLNYLHALDEPAFEKVRASVDAHLAVLNKTLFDDPPALWTLVALPAQDEGRNIVGRDHAYGAYRHYRRELIALDYHTTLRHELVHLLHHRHMDEIGQQHPIWIQEGLAVLFERHEVDDEGNVRFTPGDRCNIAKRLLQEDALLPWREVMMMNDHAFNRASHVTYAQVDAMMRFIDEKIGLRAWYLAYIAAHEKDARGVYTLEALFDAALEEIEREWLEWLDAQSFTVTR